MVDKVKVTEGMKKGTEKIPEGYELRKIEHKPYEFKTTAGKVVEVKAHTEHVLHLIKKVEAAAKPGMPAPKNAKK